jgi:hypothetical protein
MSGQTHKCAFCQEPIPLHRPAATYCNKTCKRKASERRARARKWAAIPVVAEPPPARCWPCGKLACLTEDAAKVSKRAIEARTGHIDEVRYYKCPEGWWHWTRMDATLDGFRARTGNGAT